MMKPIVDRVRKLIGIIEYYKMVYTIARSEIKMNKNPDKTFYIISGTHLKMRGLFGDINVIYRYCNYAFIKGYIPVVDFKHVPNNMIYDEEVGKVNGWETLFLQPTKYSLEDALQSKNRIFVDCHGNGSLESKESKEVPWEIDWDSEDSIDYWGKVFERIQIRPEILKKIIEKFDKTFSNEDRILGVKIRGTDYVLNKPYGHPIQPNVEDVLKHAKEIFSRYHCNKIFLGCEDKAIQERFKEEFGHILITGEVSIGLEQKEYLYDFYKRQNTNPFENNLEYLTNTIFLARCTCLISSQNSATSAIRLWKRRFSGGGMNMSIYTV